MTAIVAAVLAFIVGFALQRGGICAVLAAREVVEEGRWTRFRAFLECSVWAALALVAADASMAKSIQEWTWPSSYVAAAAGGVLFGVGALVNGACAFGSASRLASGEAPFLGVIAGFVFGATLAGQLLDVNRTAMALFGPVVASVVLLAAFGVAGWAVWRGIVALVRTGIAPLFTALLHSPAWPPSVSMFVIALANVGLFVLIVNWPYTTLLVDVAEGASTDLSLRAWLALTFLLGGFVAATSAGGFRLRTGAPMTWVHKGAAGAIMGGGAALIPGGNDTLVLLGMPLLQPSAFVAYVAMTATLLLGFWMRRLAVGRGSLSARHGKRSAGDRLGSA